MRRMVVGFTLLLSCKDASNDAPAKAEPSQREAEPTPTVEEPPPPPPDGAIVLAGPPLLVQTCADPHPCPDLLQGDGAKHCAALTLGSTDAWRLPTREEVERIRGRDGLADLSGYHWTSTSFADDPTQFWIVDPTTSQPTTVPGDRKPFRIRCVRDP